MKIERTRQELAAMPLPDCPVELEVCTRWYFGAPLHFECLITGRREDRATVQYRVLEDYNSYHGKGFAFSEHCIQGYDYSSRFWARVCGNLYCGGIARASYGQCLVSGHRSAARLERFEGYLGRKEPGRLRKPFERLAREHGAGENTAIRSSRVLIAGRVDGAAAASSCAGAQP